MEDVSFLRLGQTSDALGMVLYEVRPSPSKTTSRHPLQMCMCQRETDTALRPSETQVVSLSNGFAFSANTAC